MNAIYKPKGMAAEYADLAVNIYTGCNHGCTYCYARHMHDRFHGQGSFEHPEYRTGLLEEVYRQLNTGDYKGKLIHLCFSCDPYPAPPIDTRPTREIIRAIKAAGAHVQILTKGGERAERDFDLLDHGYWFGITISGNENAELNAEPEDARKETLKKAKFLGIKTWVSFEPVYRPKSVYKAIEWGSWIDLFRIGKLNHHPSSINWGDFGRECERLCEAYGRNYQIKDELRREMERSTE
jgi:DNA repair photolyase